MLPFLSQPQYSNQINRRRFLPHNACNITKIFMSKPVNIWESLLRESSKRGRLPEGSVLVLGHAGCGKSHLVAKLCSSVTSPNSSNSNSTAGNIVGGAGAESSRETTSAVTEPISDVIAYDSFVAGDSEESLSDDLAASRIGLWSLSEQTFQDAASIVLQPDRVDKLVIMITLDLSKVAQCRDTLIYWLREARGYMDKYYERLGEGAAARYREENITYLRNYRDSLHLPTLDASAGVGINLGVPLVVVGCKADRMVLTEAVSLKKYNELQRDLREICFKTGAALVYSSASTGINVSQLRRYILHRLYPDVLPLKMGIEPSSSELFVPAGADTLEMAAMAGAAGASDVSSALAALSGFSAATLDIASSRAVVNTSSSSGDAGADAAAVEDGLVALEDEKSWLASLQAAIEAAVQSSVALSGSLDSAPVAAPSGSSSSADAPTAAVSKPAGGGPDATAAAATTRPKTRRQTVSAVPSQAAGEGAKSDEAVRGFFESLLTK